VPLVVLSAVVAVACGGTRRRPAVLTDAGSGAPAPRPSAETFSPAAASQVVESTPDIQPLAAEGATGEELAGGGSEGGPLSDILFSFDEATLSEAARLTLESHATWIRAHGDLRILVEGHCDERGTVEYNLALGEQRARAARDYLVSLGVPAERLQTVSFGKERPLDSGRDEAAWAKNRRAHFSPLR
jgi:peptidoglycan-associated lipoprotein